MENASKALIIAGAILISILLITVGVLIMNSINPVQKGVEDEGQKYAIKIFNAQFTIFEGTSQTAQEVKSLFSTIEASNAQDTDHIVEIDNSNGCVTKPIQVRANVKYTVELAYTGGYVSKVTIKPNT